MNLNYLSDELMANMDPNVVGVAPVPLGPTGKRGNELNCAMWGINSQTKDKKVRDAAWEYIKFWASDEAERIRAQVYVENGYAKFIAPKYLRKFGYERYLREVPKGWEATLNEAMKSGRPEPYGHKCEMIYAEMTPPLDAVSLSDRTDYQALLDQATKHANERMMGILPPDIKTFRERTATVIVAIVAILFALLLRIVFRSFSSDVEKQMIAAESAGIRLLRHWKKTWPAYAILAPALISVLVWQYYPLLRGSVMSFQDYRLIGASKWVGMQNFSNVLFEPRFWRAMYNSLLFATLSLTLGFCRADYSGVDAPRSTPRQGPLPHPLLSTGGDHGLGDYAAVEAILRSRPRRCAEPDDREKSGAISCVCRLADPLFSRSDHGRALLRMAERDSCALPDLAERPAPGHDLRHPARHLGGHGAGLYHLPGRAEEHSGRLLRGGRFGRGGHLA